MKSYEIVVRNLESICGCAHAAREASQAIRELVTQRDELLAALTAIVKTLSDADEEGLIEHAQQMVYARRAIGHATGVQA